MMDVALAFASVSRGCLLRKMRSMSIDENFVEWIDSFMRDRKVVMCVDGQEGQAREITTGLHRDPQFRQYYSPYIWRTYTKRSKTKWKAAGAFLSWMISRGLLRGGTRWT